MHVRKTKDESSIFDRVSTCKPQRVLKRALQRSVNVIPWSKRGWVKHIPLLAAAQRYVSNKYLSTNVFVHKVNAGPAKGLLYPVKMPIDKAIWMGTYETEFCCRLARLVKPGYVCYDIGAYRGFCSGVMALAGADTVIVFEPLPENLSQLELVKELNPELPLLIAPIAVGNEDATTNFFSMPESSMGKLASSPFQPEAVCVAMKRIKVRKIDTLIAEGLVQAPQVIKIDVEGAELQVLEGAEGTLRKCQPHLFIEAHSRNLKAACELFLRNLNYEIEVLETNHRRSTSNSEITHLIATRR